MIVATGDCSRYWLTVQTNTECQVVGIGNENDQELLREHIRRGKNGHNDFMVFLCLRTPTYGNVAIPNGFDFETVITALSECVTPTVYLGVDMSGGR